MLLQRFPRLHPDQGGRKGQQPDRHPIAQLAAGKLYRGGAQAKSRPLRCDAENTTREQPEQRSGAGLSAEAPAE